MLTDIKLGDQERNRQITNLTNINCYMVGVCVYVVHNSQSVYSMASVQSPEPDEINNIFHVEHVLNCTE
jgi:hypothetical protein